MTNVRYFARGGATLAARSDRFVSDHVEERTWNHFVCSAPFVLITASYGKRPDAPRGTAPPASAEAGLADPALGCTRCRAPMAQRLRTLRRLHDRPGFYDRATDKSAALRRLFTSNMQGEASPIVPEAVLNVKQIPGGRNLTDLDARGAVSAPAIILLHERALHERAQLYVRDDSELSEVRQTSLAGTIGSCLRTIGGVCLRERLLAGAI